MNRYNGIKTTLETNILRQNNSNGEISKRLLSQLEEQKVILDSNEIASLVKLNEYQDTYS
jgi:hypothetical protein